MANHHHYWQVRQVRQTPRAYPARYGRPVYSVEMRHVTRASNIFATAFYCAVACFALIGNVIASATWIDWPWQLRAPLVGVFELGGVAVLAFADDRRKKGETALVAQGMSASVAVGAVALNWLGHPSHITGGVFATLSALGYGFWLLMSNARRRDHLRAAGDLPPKSPKYGVIRWLSAPTLIRRARQLALEDPDLGLFGSIAAAREETRQNAARAALREALADALTGSVDPAYRAIALSAYDLDAMVVAVRSGVDNGARANQLLARIDPTLVTRVQARPERVPDAVGNARRNARTGAPGTRAGTRSSAGGNARTGAAAERAYQTYATALDQGQPELDGTDLRALLGVTTTGAARKKRLAWRARYAQEMTDGARQRAPGAPLPDAVAGALAARKAAAELAGELNIITNREERP
jgi:hypothetical protein